MDWLIHGDVILVKTNKIKGKKQKTKVVQEGEHTGHAHRLSGPATIYQDGDQKFIRARKGSSISHEEHVTHELEGDYEVRIARQVDPFSKIVSRVVD